MRTVQLINYRRGGSLRPKQALHWGVDQTWHRRQPLPLVRRVFLTHPDLPEAFHGLTVAQVSDLHAGQFMPPGRLEQVRQVLERLAADLVVFTGDQLDRRAVDAEIFVQAFAGIEAPLGVFGILGNHDHQAGSQLAIWALEAAGITPLINAAVAVHRYGQAIEVVGVDDVEAPAPGGPDFSFLQPRKSQFRLLLCHQPRLWFEAVRYGAEVTLAGHTHGGQIAFGGPKLTLARLQSRYVAGLYASGSHLLYVSRGLGVGAFPWRLGSPPEVDCLTLCRRPGAAANQGSVSSNPAQG